MRDSMLVKKFYRDFSDDDNKYLDDLLNSMRDSAIEVPSHVISRMITRKIIEEDFVEFDGDLNILNVSSLSALPGYQDTTLTFDRGIIYEISNEGIGRTTNPFRLVVAREHVDGNTYFVKVAPSWEPEVVKILDVWRRKGKIPIYPPQHSVNQFTSDWDVAESLEEFFYQEENSRGSVSSVGVP